MPNICAHLIFGAHVADAVQKPLATPGSTYFLGCLGPDWYFYDRLPPTPFTRSQKKHGNALHAQDCAVLFDALLDAAAPGDEPYLVGFLTHIALDSTLHPFVEAHHTGIDHTRFEGVIDSIVYAQTRERVPYQPILMRRPDVSRIDTLLTEASARLNLSNVHGAYRRSYRKFRRLVPFLYDPSGRRYRFLLRAERLFRKKGLLSAFLLAAPREDYEDAMNLKKHTWINPFLPGGTSNASVPQLIDQAQSFALRLIDAYRRSDREALRAMLRNRTMQKGSLV